MVPETREERREERKEQRRERRERHRDEKCSILVAVCVSRVRGGVQNWRPGDSGPLSGRGFMRVWPQNRLFRLGFGLVRDFSENTSP